VYADLAGLPPLLIHVGEVETLRDDAVALADRATAAGTQVELWVAPGMVHVWHMFAGMVPESDRALAVVADWITARLDAP
jgi:acetyl esterase/lipase